MPRLKRGMTEENVRPPSRRTLCASHCLSHPRKLEGAGNAGCRCTHAQTRSGPFQAREDRASHHPVLVALRQEAQFFGEMGDALAVTGLGKRIRHIGSPGAALRTVGVEYALQIYRHVAKRI